MHKATGSCTYPGCDTSKDTIDVVRRTSDEHTALHRFANTATGHQHRIPMARQGRSAGAVMRKLLHSIYGMLKHDADVDRSKFYRMELQPA